MENENATGGDPLLPLLTKEYVEQAFAPFLARHATSAVVQPDGDGPSMFRIEHPWGDATLNLFLPHGQAELDELAAALNKLTLPERFSAIWHDDSKDLEVIWTAFSLSDDQKEVFGRSFNFRFNRKNYKCEFANSSRELMLLAENVAPRANPSATNFRNLQSFAALILSEDDEEKERMGVDFAKSFFIRNVRVSEKALVSMIECLNFYMSYYDALSPRILVHDIHDKVKSRTRYPIGTFPTVITGEQLDENMMSFWDATRQPNAMLRFIFYYRIIEYAAFHYMDASVKKKLLRVLSNPTLQHDVHGALKSIIGAFDYTKSEDVPRFDHLLQSAVSAETIWKEIDNNKSIFSETVRFDGGYVTEALVGKDETVGTFSKGGMVKFAVALRRMRNVLVHGRDQTTGTAITPTPRNMKFLSAWTNLIAVAAGEVVVYGNKH